MHVEDEKDQWLVLYQRNFLWITLVEPWHGPWIVSNKKVNCAHTNTLYKSKMSYRKGSSESHRLKSAGWEGICDRFQEGGSQNNGSPRDEDTVLSHVFSRTKCGVRFTSIILSPVSYLSQVLFSWILSIRKESVFEDQKSSRFNGKVVVKIVGVLFRTCSQWKSLGISLERHYTTKLNHQLLSMNQPIDW